MKTYFGRLYCQWLIAICMKKFGQSKAEVIAQIKKDDKDSLNAINSFDLSLDF